MFYPNTTTQGSFDLLVIGGGINGTGIAADAAGRGLSVCLCEQDDLAQHTSSASSKLIHGGLRYLEHYEFRMVREALTEREVLMAKAPHLIHPLRFILPHQPHLRPAWLIRAGLFLYDHLGPRQHLQGSQYLNLDRDGPLKPEFHTGFAYSDCWVDDARLVVANAQAAYEGGAKILPRTRCLRATRQNDLWHIELKTENQPPYSVTAKALVNATGPWAVQVLEHCLHTKSPHSLRLVRGSHLVVPRLYEGTQAYILQNEDRRIVFAIPYWDQFTLIGTTDCEYQGDPAQVQITEEEQSYLLDIIQRYFRQAPTEVVHRFSGVRPLFNDQAQDPSAVTRDFSLKVSTNANGLAPLLSVFGGKLTTYRVLAEQALDLLSPFFPQMNPSQTAHTALPGGEYPLNQQAVQERYPWLDQSLLQRWIKQYGCRVESLLDSVQTLEDLGPLLSASMHLYGRELDYLCQYEWAQTAEDILWRRTKLGLFLSPSDCAAVEDYLKANRPKH